MRRSDWRTFRLDRLTEPRLGGVRFEPRPLPAVDAAAFVHQSIAAMPVPYEATVRVAGTADDVRALIRYADARVEAVDDSSCRAVLRSETRAWLGTVITLLASEFEVAIEEPADLLADVRRLSRRLRAVAPATPA